MSLWMLLTLLLAAMLVASVVPAVNPPPSVIVVQLPESQAAAPAVSLPLLLLVGAILIAIVVF